MALRRQVKNVVKNFTDIEVKVREATSNDPWGPSSSLTSEIADATYNVQAFTEIMTMLWRRLNDHGKNWRHVYKALVVLDYIVKTGSERVAQQCRENIFAIQTLKDFQFIDKDGKDQGVNVREKSKQLVLLLKDDERLKNERQRALKAKERFSQTQGGIGNTSYPENRRFTKPAGTRKYTESGGSLDDSNMPSRHPSEDRAFDSRSTDGRIESDLEKVRPSNEAEEEMQLQIALAMSREEAEKNKHENESDHERFRLAVNRSQSSAPATTTGTLLDLVDPAPAPSQSNTFDPWLQQPKSSPPMPIFSDPWGSAPQSHPAAAIGNIQASPGSQSLIATPPISDPWMAPSKPTLDPWGGPAKQSPPQSDPWASTSTAPRVVPIDPFLGQSAVYGMSNGFDPRGGSGRQQPVAPASLSDSQPSRGGAKAGHEQRTPQFLSDVSHLVDVDNIVAPTVGFGGAGGGANPFMTGSVAPKSTNPFLQDKPKPKSINEIRSEQSAFVSPGAGSVLLPSPLVPDIQRSANNPFL